jgi:hypothetical protein
MPALDPVKQKSLIVASLLANVLMVFHVTDDIIRGISPPNANNANGVFIFVVWLLGILALSERIAGYVIMFLGGLFAAAMPFLHMRGRSYLRIASSSEGFFFVWDLYAVGTLGVFCMVLSAYALWNAWRHRRAGVAASQ